MAWSCETQLDSVQQKPLLMDCAETSSRAHESVVTLSQALPGGRRRISATLVDRS